jgi:hypothetical protein
LLCSNCGLPLQGGDEAAMFVCENCGLVHEPGEHGLEPFSPLTATITTNLAYAGDAQYLAVWRVAVEVTAGPESAWHRVEKTAAPGAPCVYVPAFSIARMTVHRLGASLTEAQPALELSTGLPVNTGRRTLLKDVDDPTIEMALGPDFGTISPVLVGRKDAHALAHFVFLAVESYDKHELHSVEYQLEATGEELIFIPAVWDPRQVHESNWRLLLREFDGLVA